MKDKKYGVGFVVKFAVAIGIILGLCKTTLASYALIDETNAIHISASKIENATMIIGTHLIYLGSMNDQIYDIALKSAQDANQHKRYYKSEIAGGTWYDITEAKSLADITTDGVPVSNKEIETLFMTHHTKSDGLTYYLKKNTSVCLYDISSPYNLELMSEMEPIKLQYDAMVSVKKPTDTMERDLLYIKEVYKMDRETEETKKIDEKIELLQTYYKKLLKDEADPAMCDVVMSVMEKLDASRRVKVLEPLHTTQLPQMFQAIGREYVYVEGEITGVANSVENYQKEKAAEAATEAKKQVTEQVQEIVQELEAQLDEIKADRDADIAMKTSEVKDGWERIIDIETDETKVAKYKSMMNAEVAEATEKIKQEYAKKIQEKESQISSEKAAEESKAQTAANEASNTVLNAKRDTLEVFAPNTELLAAVNEAMMKVQDSYIAYSSKMLAEGTTVLSQTEYLLINELIDKINSKSYVSCDEIVKKLMYLERIFNSVVREESAELEFIEKNLMKEAQKSYKSSLNEGVGTAYKTLSSTASNSTRNKVLKEQLSDTEIKRNELQFILQAYIDRMAVEEATNYLTKCLEETESMEKGIRADSYKNYAQSSIDSYENWLTKTLEKLQGATNHSTLENLAQKKNELQSMLLTALDKELLEEAEKLEVQIESVDREIEEAEKELNDIIGSQTASSSQKAIARAQLGAGTASANLQKLKEEALEDVRNGKLDSVINTLEGIGALGSIQPEGTLKALKEIYQELAKQELLGQDLTKLSILAEKIEIITAEQMRYLNSQYSENELVEFISEFTNVKIIKEDSKSVSENNLDVIMNRLNSEQTAMVLAGLNLYQEQNPSDLIKDYLNTYAKIAFNQGNIYVYEQLKDPTLQAVPTDKLAQITGYRYIFSNSQKVVTLQKNSNYYTFEAFSNAMKEPSFTKQMAQAAGFQGVVYIPQNIAKEYFNVTAQYLSTTSYGVILSEEMEEKALEFYEGMVEDGSIF